ncbi:MAG: ABC transporter ATP-binding protein, partial [Spirulina sp.]
MTTSPTSFEDTPSPSSRSNDWRLFLRLIPYARRNGQLFLISMLLLLPVSIAGVIQPLIIGQAISLLRGEHTWGILTGVSLSAGIGILIQILLATIAVRLAFVSLQGYLVQRVGQEITAGVREDLFSHVLSLASRFFDRSPVGRLVTRITSDVEALGDVFATGAIGILSDIIYIIVIIFTIFALEWKLASMLLLMLIPVSALIVFFQQQYRKANYRAREELSQLNSMLAENISGINVVQLFRREQFNSEMFRSVNQKYRQEIDKTIFHDSAVSATLEWIALVAIAGVLWMGGILVLQETLTFGTLSAFILYAQRLFDPLRRFAEKFTMIQSGFTAIERISELMEEPIEIRDPSENTESQFLEGAEWRSQNKPGEIRFENVWFGYKPDEYVLQDLNFTIRPGEKVALVGPTGAGKSSIIRLLCRLYEPSKGRIIVDGIDIRDLRQAQLRRYIGVILQESFLFAGDVKRNTT